MREFKFRAWDLVPYYDDEEERRQMKHFNLEDVKVIENLSLKSKIMQFTGLKDKNGKDIYEGDIVLNILEGHGEIRNCVMLKEGAFVLKEKGYEATIQLKDMASIIEVIGNIYENPELLKV